MTRITSAAAAILGTCIAFAAFGFFASVGLAVFGFLAVLATVGMTAAWVQSRFMSRDAA
ncbi:hypothetical protein [Jannaschia sp. M317]|uniref:hypothetical protein n=1 Tax=Jannaschia sp. M317 TaxID=2867011 RepID=UPI0021A6C08E|nr:hypothetical protein [Jannaschia sp. M317]UWQ16960.1 hypothetical protein K3551_13815 [Jannaschia sp. M317]